MSEKHKASRDSNVETKTESSHGNDRLERAQDIHHLRNASGADVQLAESKRSRKWEGSFTGVGERTPVLMHGTSLKEAEKTNSALNQSRFQIDLGDGIFETSGGRQKIDHDERRDSKGREVLPFGTPKELQMTEEEIAKIEEQILKTMLERGYDPHTVRDGDNLWDLSKKQYGDSRLFGVILNANRFAMAQAQGVAPADVDPRQLCKGMVLQLPKPLHIDPRKQK